MSLKQEGAYFWPSIAQDHSQSLFHACLVLASNAHDRLYDLTAVPTLQQCDESAQPCCKMRLEEMTKQMQSQRQKGARQESRDAAK